MIYVHKILPLFLLPTGFSLLLLLTGLMLRRKALCWIGVAVLWLASTPLVSNAIMRAAEGWETRRSLLSVATAAAIVVLSTGRVQPPGDPTVSEWTDADRFHGGIELYKASKAPLLVFTGGWVPWQPTSVPEGDVLMRHAEDLGVPRDRMLTTARVMTTDEESHAVAKLLAARLPAKAAPRILLVTSAFHMRRARLLFARAGLETDPFPVDFKVPAGETFTALDLLPNGISLSRSEAALREFYGLAYYRTFGG